MTVREILVKYLTDNGFGGLVGDECGCDLNDLCPCDGSMLDCQPAYSVPCTGCGECDGYEGEVLDRCLTLNKSKEAKS